MDIIYTILCINVSMCQPADGLPEIWHWHWHSFLSKCLWIDNTEMFSLPTSSRLPLRSTEEQRSMKAVEKGRSAESFRGSFRINPLKPRQHIDFESFVYPNSNKDIK